jgi:hypothetical protein
MATRVLEAREGRLAELLRLLMPFPGRLEFAVRLALICALTTLEVEIYQTPDPALTVFLPPAKRATPISMSSSPAPSTTRRTPPSSTSWAASLRPA